MLQHARAKVFGQCPLLESRIVAHAKQHGMGAQAIDEFLDIAAEKLLYAGYVDGLAQKFMTERCQNNMTTFIQEIDNLRGLQ